ncbi:trypsin-like peptidase domain-containing protein [Streptomyces sp. NRRL S-1022]|uniref:trypsin-like peptidase domain-containing protein n=1 Tax=Streptomyces sp. NRRL S-1022 TaxID=1463880 RepID=UPI0006917FDF|nr:trypsin-like serine protease [Streptomyces sp. NRRL S-1022]
MSPPTSGDADTTVSPTLTPTASPSASSGADDDDTALEQYWTPERMADAIPVEEDQERTTRTSSSTRKSVQTSPSHYFEGIKEVGTFYWDERRDGQLYHRYCAGTVVPSPGHNLVLSAAHCFDDQDQQKRLVFVPKHSHDHPAPYGLFPIKVGQIYADPRYLRKDGDHDYTDLDFAFLKIEPRSDGKKVQDVVGAIPIGYSTGFDHPKTRVIGYPWLDNGDPHYKPKQDPLDCTSPMKKFTTGDAGGWKGGTFSQIDCDGYVSGTSGGPFIIGGDEPKVVGVTGGWQTGGHTDDTSYSSYFDSDLKRIYDAAAAGKKPAPIVLPAASTWKHAKDIASGYFALDGPVSDDRMDMFVLWSDGELTIYRGADKGLNYFDKEIRVQKRNKFWAEHAKQVVAGDFTGDNGSDLIVLWSDGEVTLYPSVDEQGFHGEKQIVAPNPTWKHASAMTAGRYGGNKWQDDLVVRWSDGELTVYQNTGASLGKEIKVVGKNEHWTHAVEIGSGDYTQGDTWDLVVRWSDGELTLYDDFTGTGDTWGEHKWKAPNDLWEHAMLVTGGDFSDNPWPDDTLVRWSDGELSLYTEGNKSGIGTEHQLVAP